MNEPYSLVCLKGFTRKEAEAVTLFSERMHEISLAERRPVCLVRDGGVVLAGVVREVFPKYSDRKATKFMLRVLNTISEAIRLHDSDPQGSA